MAVNTARAARKRLVKLGPGVWVRQSPDGENLCKIMHCRMPPASEEQKHRGMCHKHLEKVADGRPRCQKCGGAWCVDPYVDGMCEQCHPSYQELQPFEAQVLNEIRKGAGPVTAVQTAMGEGATRVAAQRKLERLSKRERFHRVVMRELESAGATPSLVAQVVTEGLAAKKRVYNGEGECIDEAPDQKTRNQTVDIWAKLTGAYPSRTNSAEEKPRQQMNIAVAMLPAVEPRRPDAKIYTLPSSKRKAGEADDE